MTDDRVVVKFVRARGAYGPGTLAAFPVRDAESLVRKGVAVWPPPDLVAAFAAKAADSAPDSAETMTPPDGVEVPAWMNVPEWMLP